MARMIDTDRLPVKSWKKTAAMFQDDYTAGAGTDWALKVAMAENRMLWEIISAIENAPTITQPNEPLTEEQLEKMIGEPIWVESARRKEWMLLWGYHGPEVYGRAFIFTRRTAQKEQFPFSELRVTWWPYRRPPEGEG